MEKGDKVSTLTRMGVSGLMFLLVPAYPGCPGQTAVKWLLLLLLLFLQTFILKQCLSGYVLHDSLLHLILKNGDFLNIHISQGSVATRLGCGGMFIYHLVANFLLSPTVKNFENRLIFGEVMGKSLVSCFFLTHGVYSQCFDAIGLRCCQAILSS